MKKLNKNNLIDKYKRVNLLDKTVSIFFPTECEVVEKKIDSLEVFFSPHRYPSLGIHLECFDNPKLNNIESIKKFLNRDLNVDKNISIKNDIFSLNYEIKIDNEKLIIWKILHFFKPRSFRLLRFSLTWPDNEDACKVVAPILKMLSSIVSNLKFNESRTQYDEIGYLKYKLDNVRLKSYKFWNFFSLKLPINWNVEYSEQNSFVKIIIGTKNNFNFLIEKFNIEIDKSKKNNDKIVETLIQEITKEVSISNTRLKKSKNNDYLFYCTAIERDIVDKKKINNNQIWYRIKVLDNKIMILSIIFELSSQVELENKVYLEKLNEIIDGSEILINPL